MAFSVSGTVITQTGTDTNSAGLSGKTGITYVEDVVNTKIYRTITVASGYTFSVQGNWTITEGEFFFFPNTSTGIHISVDGGATFTQNKGSVLNFMSAAGTNYDVANTAICCNSAASGDPAVLVLNGRINTNLTVSIANYPTGYPADNAVQVSGSPEISIGGTKALRVQNVNMGAPYYFPAGSSSNVVYNLYGGQALLMGNPDTTDVVGFNLNATTLIYNNNAVPLTTVDGFDTRGNDATATGDIGISGIGGTNIYRFVNSYKGTELRVIGRGVSADYGTVEVSRRVSITAKDSALAAITTGGIYIKDYNNGGRPTGYTADAPLEQDFNGSGVVSGYLVYKINTTTYTGHTLTARQYGYQRIANPESPSGLAITKDVLLTADSFITEATEATVAAYTGIALNYTTKELTVSFVGTRTLDQLYDYIRYSDALQANIDETDTISSPDGTNYILKTDWDLIVAGNGTLKAVTVSQPLKSLAYQGTGALTITNDGFFEDKNLAEWELAGTIYKASHFFTNVKNNVTSTNIQNAVVAYINSTGVDVTYSTALVNLGLVSDASGNAEGYAVYAIGGTTDSAVTQYVGEYDHAWSIIPKTVSGTSIGTAASYETTRLADDDRVTLTKANALLVSGVVTDHVAFTCDMNLNSLSQTYDNLKARQARTNDIETGVAGYMSYYDLTTYSDTGLILRYDGSIYWGGYKWTFQNSGGGGTLKERDAVGVATTQVSIDITNLAYCSFTGTDIAFDSATKTISSTTTDLTNFYDGQSIVITGSASNNGTFTVSGSPIATALIVVEALVNESAGASVTINGGVGSRIQILNTTGRDESDWAATTAYSTGDGVRATAKGITSITRTGNTATVTMVGHGFSSDWHVLISGAVETEYNGLKDITVTGADTFTFGVGGNPASPATGTILIQNEQFWYECVTPGTTGGTEPTWNNVEGNTTADGTVVWKTRVIELLNTEATTTSAGVAYEHKGTNRAIRVRVMYVCGVKAKKWHTFTGTVTTNGFSQDAAQVDNDVYIDNNINGSLVTEFAVIEDQIRIYVDDPDNTTTAQRIYNWFQYHLGTHEGIYDQDDYILAADQTHYTLKSSQKIVNLDTVNPLQITGANIVPTSGTATAIYDVTNGASLILNFNRVEAFQYSTGSGLSAAQDQKITDILADTADIQPKIGTPAVTLAADIAGVTAPTAAAVADAVWDEVQSGHVTAGTFGKYLDTEVSGVGGGTPPTVVQIRQEMDSNSTQLAAIKSDTGKALTTGKFIALK